MTTTTDPITAAILDVLANGPADYTQLINAYTAGGILRTTSGIVIRDAVDALVAAGTIVCVSAGFETYRLVAS